MDKQERPTVYFVSTPQSFTGHFYEVWKRAGEEAVERAKRQVHIDEIKRMCSTR